MISETGDISLAEELQKVMNSRVDIPPPLSELAIQEDLYNKVEEIRELLAMPNLTPEQRKNANLMMKMIEARGKQKELRDKILMSYYGESTHHSTMNDNY
jgi:hypothetical protein